MGILTLFWMVTLLPALGGATDVVDRIVAVVNEDIILLSELNTRMAPFAQRIHAQGFDIDKERQTVYSVREDLLNRLIDEKLTDQEIQRYNIKVDDAEVDNTIERIKAGNSSTDEDLRTFLERESMTMEQYREKIREQLMRARLVNYQVKSKIVITEEDIRDYYDKHPENYGVVSTYHLRNILMRTPPGASSEERAAIAATVESIRARVTDAASFAELARSYSQSPTADHGGDLGEFTKDTFSPQIQRALEGLKAGQTTPVLDTDQGFQLFFIEAINQQSGKPFESVKAEIHQKLYNDIVDTKFLSWLEELRGQSHIKIIN
jgi:peptidyl-prolyl cis-trans isomerase SurA